MSVILILAFLGLLSWINAPGPTLHGTVVSWTCVQDNWIGGSQSLVIVSLSGPMRTFTVHQSTCEIFAVHPGSNVTVGTWVNDSAHVRGYVFPDGTSSGEV